MAQKKYEQAAAWMKNKIEIDHLTAGDRLPGEFEMAKELGFSRQTIRQAIRVLEQQGILTSRQGSGIYVAAPIAEQPDAAAVSERFPSFGKRFGTVTIISTYLDDYIFPATMRGMQQTLAEHGYTARIELTDNRVMTERSILKRLLETIETDGLIVEAVKSALPNPNLDYYRQLQKAGVRIAFFHSSYPDLRCPCVRIDDEQSARDAVKLLFDAGRTKIAGIFKSDDGQGQRRYRGYLQAHLEAAVPVDEDQILWIPSAAYRSIDTIEDLLFSGLEGADGVLCYNDELAIKIMERAADHGRSIPGDLSVVSIDDSSLAQLSKIGLTSFSYSRETLGREAAEKVVRMIEGSSGETDLLIPTVPACRSSISKI